MPDVAEIDRLDDGDAGDEERHGHDGEHAQLTTRHESTPVRLVGFLRGCWRELQRVQWPDRAQVMQATGVVIGFVIIVAIFLGVCDLVASKLVNLVLK